MGESTLTAEDRDTLRNVKFCHLTEDEFRLLEAECRHRKISLWSNDVYVERRPTPNGRNQILIGMTVQGLLSRAQATGEYVGCLPLEWAGPDGKWMDLWTTKSHPFAARAQVKRRGHEHPTVAVAHWTMYARPEDPFWQRGGPFMLGKCAIAVALRQAFPDALNGVYGWEELDRTRRPMPDNGFPRLVDAAGEDDATPDTWQSFELALIHDLNFGDREYRARVIRDIKEKYAHLMQSPRLLFAKALAELKAAQVG